MVAPLKQRFAQNDTTELNQALTIFKSHDGRTYKSLGKGYNTIELANNHNVTGYITRSSAISGRDDIDSAIRFFEGLAARNVHEVQIPENSYYAMIDPNASKTLRVQAALRSLRTACERINIVAEDNDLSLKYTYSD